MSIQALRERLAASNKEAKNLLAEKGSATWSKEDQVKFDNIMDECDRTERQIVAHEKLIEKDQDKTFSDVENHRIDRDLRNGKTLTPGQIAFNTFLRKSDREMTIEEATAVRNTMSTTTGTQGGYTVQAEVARQLVDTIKAYGFMRKVASQITTSQGNPLSYPTSDGTGETGEWVAQNTDATAADPTFGTVALNVFKVGSKVIVVPIELLQDSQIDIQAMVFKRAAQRIGRTSNAGYTVGDGTTMPQGIVGAVSVGKVGLTGQTTTIIYDDLVDMVDSVDIGYLSADAVPNSPSNAPGWMFSQTVRKMVRKIKDTAGRPIWTPSYDGGITKGAPDELLGYPVYLNNDMPAPAANAKSTLFGNLSEYLIRDAMDITIFRFDDSAYMKKGQVGFLAWARTGGNMLDPAGTKAFQHSAT